MARIELRVRPGSARDALTWDAWRHRWIVHCRAPPVEGEANRSVAALMAGWLAVPPHSVRWFHAGKSRTKALDVEGITDLEADGRLRAHLEPEGRP